MAQALFQHHFVEFGPYQAELVESEAGLIPRGWEVRKLSELCKVARGASPRPIMDYLGGTVPWIKIADATSANGPFLFETKEKIKEEGVNKSILLTPGSLILSNSATCGIPIFLDLEGCIHDGWLYFRDLQLISKNYLYHVLLRLSVRLNQMATGSVQNNLNTDLLGSQLVLVPNGSTLKQFDDITVPLFNKILLNGRENRKLAEIRDYLLPRLLSGQVEVF